MDYKFSVAMCVYKNDSPSAFETAVNSVLNQTTKPNEVVLVVDGPIPKELGQLVDRYEKNPIFKVLRLSENQGHGNARRIGLTHCSNDFVALMDADDISVRERFAIQLDFLSKHPKCDVVGGQIEEFVGDVTHPVGKRVVPLADADIKQYMKQRCPFNQMTVMLRKRAVEEAGGYLDWYCNEDYYLWIRMAQHGASFGNVPQTLVNVRVGNEMYRRRGGRKYFASEAALQKYMYREKLIGFRRYTLNVAKRFVVQILLPSRLRGWVFRCVAREKA